MEGESFISDDFIELEGIDKTTPLKLIISILEEFNAEVIKNVCKYMNVLASKLHNNHYECFIVNFDNNLYFRGQVLKQIICPLAFLAKRFFKAYRNTER